jgi:rhamnogalacturonyl hydrolase YesR
MGLLYALYFHGVQRKWSQLGRAAYLEDKAHYFDKYITNPAPAIHYIVPFVIFALGLFMLYKALEFVVLKVLSPILSDHSKESG